MEQGISVTLTGAEVKARRHALGWSQQQLANALGINRVTVAKWEGGAPIETPRMLDLALTQLEERTNAGAAARGE